MSSFAAWGITILALAVISTVAEMLLPKGKTRNVIRSVTASVAVLAIITPIPNLLKNGFKFDFSADEVEIDGGYLQYVDGVKEEMLVNSVKNYLSTKGLGVDFDLKLEVDGWTVKSATVNFSQSVITGGDEHINKSEIIKSIADYFGIDEEAVMSYG
ncbi:MAG: hypothetical protein HDT28_06905 [Clostridiales bacterium]|nr:hypothetical protein [Clostridiales bacterium]